MSVGKILFQNTLVGFFLLRNLKSYLNFFYRHANVLGKGPILKLCFIESCTGNFVMVPLNLTRLHCLQTISMNISSIDIIFLER